MSFTIVMDAATGEPMMHSKRILLQDVNNSDNILWCNFTRKNYIEFNVDIESAIPASVDLQEVIPDTVEQSTSATANVQLDQQRKYEIERLPENEIKQQPVNDRDVQPTAGLSKQFRDTNSIPPTKNTAPVKQKLAVISQNSLMMIQQHMSRPKQNDVQLDTPTPSVSESKNALSEREEKCELEIGMRELIRIQEGEKETLFEEEETNKISVFPITDTESAVIKETFDNDEMVTTDTTLTANSKAILWKRNDILELIKLYEEAIPLFKSTSIKNRKVWQHIASKLKPFTPTQCENKFKYIKKRYVDKVDNMGNTDTDAKRLNCEFFNELDSIFHKSHNVYPPVLTSSERGSENIHQKPSNNSSPSGYESGDTTSQEDSMIPVIDVSVIAPSSSNPTTTTTNTSKKKMKSKPDETEWKKQRQESRDRMMLALEKIANSFAEFVQKM